MPATARQWRANYNQICINGPDGPIRDKNVTPTALANNHLCRRQHFPVQPLQLALGIIIAMHYANMLRFMPHPPHKIQ